MAIGQRLEFRQSQSLVITPQLLQAIKLLQLSAPELQAYVEGELEKNPLLERSETELDPQLRTETVQPDDARVEGDWSSDQLQADTQSSVNDFGVERALASPDERVVAEPPSQLTDPGKSLMWDGVSSGSSIDENPDLEAYLAASVSLHDHLEMQLGLAIVDPLDRVVGAAIIASIDETGYLSESLDDIAARLGFDLARTEAILAIIQQFDPSGIGARSLQECLSLQLRDKDRLDPAMRTVIEHLDLLAKRDFGQLKRLAKVDDEDLADMVAEIRRLNPKPGSVFGMRPIEPVTPDVFVAPTSNGGWRVDLNSSALPRVLANRAYYAEVSVIANDKTSKAFIEEAWQSANWLTRSLEQRAKTILKVASEIVRQQDAFFVHGVTRLKPMNLKTVAEQVGLHESTISRVTSNKFMASPRGIFEMKYFFTAAISAANGEQAHSAEAVRYRVKELIDQEAADDVLSDDAIVDKLKAIGIDIARRTVAKYREAMRIPSSASRRRERRAMIPTA